MKKVLSTLVIFFAIAISASAQQVSIGLRSGISFAPCAEWSYQRELRRDRIELNIGGALSSVDMYVYGAVTYQWVFPLSRQVNWYVGTGGAFGIFNYDRIELDWSGFMTCAHGQVGIEYYFPHAPLQLSLDWRPALKYATDAEGLVFHPEGIVIGFRYSF